MKMSKLNRFGLVLTLLLPLVGCDDKQPDPAQKQACEQFAKHLAYVVQAEQGETVPQEQVDKMVAATVETCLASPPKDDELKCAMAVQDTKSMKACDPEAQKPQ